MDTWLLEFWFKPKNFRENKKEIFDQVCDLVRESFLNCEVRFKDVKENPTAFLTNLEGVNIHLQGKDDGLLIININNQKIQSPITKAMITAFEFKVRQLSTVVKPKTAHYDTVLNIKRGRPIYQYDSIGDGSVIERDFDKIAFDDVSEYQHVRIFHSRQYGNCLYLDNDLNLAESDLEYTRAITGSDKEDYTNKTVLILGGGDGGILHYLRDKGPSMITMIDIDQMVIDAAKIHLRGICYDVLDNLTGKNYQVIVDDCVKHLKSFVQQGRKFDFVINDLTAIPVSTEPVGEHWDFMRLILKLSMKVLHDKGKYFTQGNSQLRSKSLSVYEDQFIKLDIPVKFKTQIVHVPSYMENWVFYTIWKDI